MVCFVCVLGYSPTTTSLPTFILIFFVFYIFFRTRQYKQTCFTTVSIRRDDSHIIPPDWYCSGIIWFIFVRYWIPYKNIVTHLLNTMFTVLSSSHINYTCDIQKQKKNQEQQKKNLVGLDDLFWTSLWLFSRVLYSSVEFCMIWWFPWPSRTLVSRWTWKKSKRIKSWYNRPEVITTRGMKTTGSARSSYNVRYYPSDLALQAQVTCCLLWIDEAKAKDER